MNLARFFFLSPVKKKLPPELWTQIERCICICKFSPGSPLTLRLEKEKAIALAFRRPSSLFVFIFIYPGKLCRALSFGNSNALHTRSAADIKAWELPATTTVWCQSAPSEQSAVEHLAQGHLKQKLLTEQNSAFHSLPASRFSSLLRSRVCFFFLFSPRGRCSTIFFLSPLSFCLKSDPSLPITLTARLPK